MGHVVGNLAKKNLDEDDCILLHQDGYVNHVGKKEEIHGLSFVQKYIYIYKTK